MKNLRRAVTALYVLMTAAVLWVVLTAHDTMTYIGRKNFLFQQNTILLIGSAALLALSMPALRPDRQRIERFSGAAAKLLCWGALFVFQAFVSFHAYFLTTWDAGIVLSNAYYIGSGYAQYVDNAYYSVYPNNILITEIYAAMIRLFRMFAGDAGLDRCAYIIIVFQCALNTCTGAMLTGVARDMTGSRRFARLVGLVYIVFIGISPWVMIPYSDSMGLIVPVSLLYLNQLRRKARREWPVFAAMGAVAACGFLIKPQTMIALIAILIIEAMRVLSEKNWGNARNIAAALAIVLLGLGPVRGAIFSHSSIKIEPGHSVGMAHYLMMGLNEETGGLYSREDTRFSSESDPEGRLQRQLETAKQRFVEMWPDRLLDHIRLKTVIDYADATFAWGEDGVFFANQLEDKDALFSPFFKSILYSGRPRFRIFATWLQCLWLGLLAGSMLGVVFAHGAMRENPIQLDGLLTLLLTLIGLMLFELLFEARARFLYTHAPLYLLAGVCGWRYLCAAVYSKIRRLR